MPGIVRNGDKHIGHASPCDPFHQTPYVAGLNTSVYVNGKLGVVLGDSTACGDPATSGSSTVFFNGIAVHRLADSTGGHPADSCGENWFPNASGEASTNVIAG
jgi:uncharacterized Zn-binding protein involved in type VI secretion